MKDEKSERLVVFMATTGKESMGIVKIAIALGLDKEEYMMALEAMWDMCPLNKDANKNECV